MVNTRKISFNIELSTLFKKWIGYQFLTIHAQKGTISIGHPIGFSAIGDIILGVYDKLNRVHENLKLLSQGHESYAGNLFGVNVEALVVPERRFDKLGYNFGIVNDFGTITKIVGLGEVRKEDVITAGQEDEIEAFFPAGTKLPDIISIDKKTLEVIGFQFDNSKWMYLFPEGEGYFRFEFESDLSPEELINQWETIDDVPKPLQVLQVFE